MTTITEDRVRDLLQTAAELRAGRPERRLQASGPLSQLRVRIGIALVAAGTMLVSSARPIATDRG